MKTNLFKKAAILCSAAMMVLSSCAQKDNTPDSPTDQSLVGSWIVDLDGQGSVDMAFLTLNIAKDAKAELGIVLYDYESDSYEQQSVSGTTRALSDIESDGMVIKRLEMTLSDASQKLLGGEEVRDTLCFTFDGKQAKMLIDTESKGIDADGDGNIEDFAWDMTPGVLNVQSLDKATARSLIKEVMDAEAEEEEEEAQTKAGTTRDLKSWMKDIPNDRKVRDLLIPGTHDAATCGMAGDWSITIGKTQRKKLGEQWDSGIRYFDLRTRYRTTEQRDMMFHEMLDCSMNLDLCIDEIVRKLKEHSSTDGVIISIKAESNMAGVSDAKAFWLVELPKHLGGSKYWVDMRGFLNKAADLGIFKFDFTARDERRTMIEAVKVVEKQLLDAGLLAKWTPDMTMQDLRGKAVVMFDNDVKDVDYGRIADYVVIKEGKKLYSPSKSRQADCDEQNIYEVPDKMSYDNYIKLKKDEFNKLCASSKTKTDNKWVFNAANGYQFECGIFPNYAKVCQSAYPGFAQSIKDNAGCRGLILLDYAGDNSITRVNIFKLATNTVATVFGANLIGQVINLVKKDKDKLIMFKAGYWALEKVTPNDKVQSQDLVGTIVEGNFK